MFGALAVAYLFLGGAGAGAVLVACLVDLLRVRAPFGPDARLGTHEMPPEERAVAATMLAGLLAVGLGIVCLVLDLGRADRILALVLHPSLSLITLGAYALGALLACAALLTAVRYAYLPRVPRTLVRGVEVVCVPLSVAVALYTGLLLWQIGAVELWHSPLVPALFVLSALSCGAALGLLSARMSGATTLAHVLARCDAALIAIEVVLAALFMVQGTLRSGEAMGRLLTGDLALSWWGGFVLCGMLVPLAVELACLVWPARGREAGTLVAVAALLVLLGGVCLRAGLAQAGRAPTLALAGEAAATQPQPHDSPRLV